MSEYKTDQRGVTARSRVQQYNCLTLITLESLAHFSVYMLNVPWNVSVKGVAQLILDSSGRVA